RQRRSGPWAQGWRQGKLRRLVSMRMVVCNAVPQRSDLQRIVLVGPSLSVFQMVYLLWQPIDLRNPTAGVKPTDALRALPLRSVPPPTRIGESLHPPVPEGSVRESIPLYL